MHRRKGNWLFVVALGLALASLVGAWSFSMATIGGSSSYMISQPDQALLSVPDFGNAPVVTMLRNSTHTVTFPVINRSQNDVTLTLELLTAPERMSVSVSPSMPGAYLPGGSVAQAELSIATARNTRFGVYELQIAVSAHGVGYSVTTYMIVYFEVVNRL